MRGTLSCRRRSSAATRARSSAAPRTGRAASGRMVGRIMPASRIMLGVSWKFVAVAMEAVLRAGALQKERYGDPTLIVEHKGTLDLVTEVDRACETSILEILRGRFPDHDIVTEESHIDRTGSRYVWFVDPL